MQQPGSKQEKGGGGSNKEDNSGQEAGADKISPDPLRLGEGGNYDNKLATAAMNGVMAMATATAMDGMLATQRQMAQWQQLGAAVK
jgi:hypothetical protein